MQKKNCCSSVMKKSCAWQKLDFITQTKKNIYSADGCETEIEFVHVGGKYRKVRYVKGEKVIPWELQHRLVVVDLDKKVSKKVVRKPRTLRRKIWKLNENRTGLRFEKSKRTSAENSK